MQALMTWIIGELNGSAWPIDAAARLDLNYSCESQHEPPEIEPMSDEKLRQSLDELRSELQRLESEEAQVRERLNALISGVETRLDTPDDTALSQSLTQDLRQSISQFEVSHPRATAILNEIMVTLGNMGI